MMRAYRFLILLVVGAWQLGCRPSTDSREFTNRESLRAHLRDMISSSDEVTDMAPTDRAYHKAAFARGISILDRYRYPGARIPPTQYSAILAKDRGGTTSGEVVMGWIESGNIVLGVSFKLGERSFSCKLSESDIAALDHACDVSWSVDRNASVMIYPDTSQVPKDAAAVEGTAFVLPLVAPELLEAITEGQSFTVQLILKDGSLTSPPLEVHKWQTEWGKDVAEVGAGQNDGVSSGSGE